MAGFNVSRFRSIIDANGGLTSTNKFLVEIPVPKGLVGVAQPVVGGSSGILSFYCKTGVLPGIGILSNDLHRYGYGPIERKPYGTVFNDAVMNFYADSDNRVRAWFRKWIRLIINPDTRNGMGTTFSLTGSSAYELAYKEQYAVDVTVTVFDPEGNATARVVMVESYPNFIGDVIMDWDDKNNIMTLPVSMTYKDWYEESVV